MTEHLPPRWADSPAEVAGLLVMGVGSALYSLVVIAQVWRDQVVTVWPMPILVLAGAAIYTGHRLASLRASREGGLAVDVEERADE